MLFLPEVELDYSNPEWTDTMPFGWGLLKDGDLYAELPAPAQPGQPETGFEGQARRGGAEL